MSDELTATCFNAGLLYTFDKPLVTVAHLERIRFYGEQNLEMWANAATHGDGEGIVKVTLLANPIVRTESE